jgi:hypothetical protein
MIKERYAMENTKSVFEKFEIVKCEPYRFIGECVYLGNKGPNKRLCDIYDFLWKQSAWTFKMLDDLKEYASDEVHNAALFTWERYDDKNQLFGYYVGRFMKAGTPIPEDLDYFDIDENYMAKAWKKGKLGERFGNMLIYAEQECKDEIELAGAYNDRGWVCMAELYPKADENGESFVGVYIPCELKNPPQS